MESRTHKILQDFDKKKKELRPDDNSAPTAEIWQEIIKFNDLNEMLRINVAQIQSMCQEIFDEIHNDKIQEMDEFKGLICGGEKEVELYSALMEKHDEKIHCKVMAMNLLTKTLIALNKEYRDCAASRRTSVPVSQVEKMALAFRAVLHEKIQDINLLMSISDALQDTMRDLFPPSAAVN